MKTQTVLIIVVEKTGTGFSAYAKEIDGLIAVGTDTLSLSGMVVSLFAANDVETERLEDPKVILYKKELGRIRQLLLLCFILLFALGVFTVFCA